MRKILIFFPLLLAGCPWGGEEHHQEDHYHEIVVSDMGTDIKAPKEIWSLIEGEGEKIQAGSVQFMPIKVRVSAKNDGVLTYPKTEFSFPRGGGEIDLAQIVTDVKGSFFVDFILEQDDPENTRVFFVSRTKKRRIDDEVWGQGCKTFSEVTKFFFDKIRKQEFKLNTTRARHISVLGGHFIFSQKRNKQLFMSQVTFKDSGQTHLFCDSE